MLELTFARMWDEAVAGHGDRCFLLFESPGGAVTEWTYREFDAVVDGMVGRLAESGVGPGDAVHLALANCPTFVALWLAAARMGAWIVPADPRATSRELADQLRRTGARVGVCADARSAPYLDAAKEAGLSAVWRLAEDVGDLAVSTTSRVRHEARPLDRLAVMFTSGTTSRPKGVVLSQRLYAFTGERMAEAAALGREHRWLVVLPLFHANAQYYCFASAVRVGAGVALMPRFSASSWSTQAARHQVTHASMFAAPLRMVLARTGDSTPRVRLEQLWYAQNVTAAQYERLTDLVGCRPRQLYGMTETGPAVLTDRSPGPQPDTVGTPTPGCTLRVTEPSVDSPAGELQVRGVPGRTLFTEYLDDPETTRRSRRPDGDGADVWFDTGDLMVVRPDGRYRFAGRGSDIVKVGGENVSLAEVEAALAEHPDLSEVAAVGRADAMLDEVVVAFAVPADPAAPPKEESLSAWCAARLPTRARPRAFHLVDELPRTSVGKIKRHVLRDSST